MNALFSKVSDRLTGWVGSPLAVILAFVGVGVWFISGPLFGFSDTWQLAINTSTTIITFWMVFLIQASQNRSVKALQLKLDEIISWMDAQEPNEAIGAEDKTEQEIDELHQKVRSGPEAST